LLLDPFIIDSVNASIIILGNCSNPICSIISSIINIANLASLSCASFFIPFYIIFDYSKLINGKDWFLYTLNIALNKLLIDNIKSSSIASWNSSFSITSS